MSSISLQQFRQVSAGKYNLGDVHIDANGKVAYANNHAFRTGKNCTEFSVAENVAVRTALFKAFSSDAHMSKEMVEAFQKQILGENAVRSLSRREIAIYVAAFDRGSVDGLENEVNKFRRRMDTVANTKLVRDIQYVPSPNEKLDDARIAMQRARQALESIGDKTSGLAGNYGDQLDKAWDHMKEAVRCYNGLAGIDPNATEGELDKIASDKGLFQKSQTAQEAKDFMVGLFKEAANLVVPAYRDEVIQTATGNDAAFLAPSTLALINGSAEVQIETIEVVSLPKSDEISPREVNELLSQFPLNSDDRTDFIASADRMSTRLDKKISDLEASPDAESVETRRKLSELKNLKAAVTDRKEQVSALKGSNPFSYRNVEAGLKSWACAADALYREICKQHGVTPRIAFQTEIFTSVLPEYREADADKECPNTAKLVHDIDKRLANKVRDILARHIGRYYDKSSLRDCLEHLWKKVLNRQEWKPIEKNLSFDLAVGGDTKNVKAKSSIRPAKSIPGFAKNVQYNEGVNGIMCNCYKSHHAVNMAQSTYEVDGQVAFAGVRHGVVSACKIQKPDERKAANEQRAKEVVTAAVLTNQELLRKVAENGDALEEPVELLMTSTSLLTPDPFRKILKAGDPTKDERQMLKEQVAAWEKMNAQEITVEIPLDPEGKTFRTVRVKPKVIPFNFGVNDWSTGTWLKSNFAGGWGDSDALNAKSIPLLKEAVGDRLKKLEAQMDELSQKNGKMSDELFQLRSKYRAIDRLMNDIDSVLAKKGERSDKHDAYKVVARINVLTWLLGGTPAWNCKSGKDRTGELDVESKFLATLVAKGLALPRPGAKLTPEQQAVFRTIALQGGNHELQTYNTGFAGFKTEGVESIGERLGGKDYGEAHSGLSEHVLR